MNFGPKSYDPLLSYEGKDDSCILSDVKGKYRWKYHYYKESEIIEEKIIEQVLETQNSVSVQTSRTYNNTGEFLMRPSTNEIARFVNLAKKLDFNLDSFSLDIVLYISEK